jgi:hypothetical protein
MKTILPFFPGFYNSNFDSYFDLEVEQELEDKNLEYKDIEHRLDYRRGRLMMAQAIVKVFNKESKLNLSFKELVSPREYNFTNDKIICEISKEEFLKCREEVLLPENQEFLIEVIRKFFTSRDGFIPFYSNEIEDWTEEKDEYDSVEALTILTAYCKIQDFDEDCFDDDASISESAQHIWIN